MDVLALLRRIVGDVDETVSDDTELFTALQDAQQGLELKRMPGLNTLVVTPAASTITPDPTTEQGHLLALYAAIMLLDQSYRERLSRGELGTSWTSGLEGESTISAAKAYKDAIDRLRSELADLIAITLTAGVRVQ
jgi:hypothetical protein